MNRRDWIVLLWNVLEAAYQFFFVIAVATLIAAITFWFIIREHRP